MANKKKLLFNITFVLIVLIFVIYKLFREVDLEKV